MISVDQSHFDIVRRWRRTFSHCSGSDGVKKRYRGNIVPDYFKGLRDSSYTVSHRRTSTVFFYFNFLSFDSIPCCNTNFSMSHLTTAVIPGVIEVAVFKGHLPHIVIASGHNTRKH